MSLVWLSDLRLNAMLTGPATAPPLVLIHGLGLDLRVWDALLPCLGQLCVLRFDQRGHGTSDTPPAPYTLGALIRDAERLMDHFALKDAVVLGLGEGGLVAQGLAAKRLDLVRAMVLSGSATRFGTFGHWMGRIGGLTSHGVPLDAECQVRLGRNWQSMAESPAVGAMLSNTRLEGWEGHAAALATADLYQTTATLTLPTLILAGGDDRKVPPDMQRELADLVAGAELRLLPGAGHLAMLTHPDAFAEPLLAFLARIGHD